jgi:hypothetical protein
MMPEIGAQRHRQLVSALDHATGIVRVRTTFF